MLLSETVNNCNNLRQSLAKAKLLGEDLVALVAEVATSLGTLNDDGIGGIAVLRPPLLA